MKEEVDDPLLDELKFLKLKYRYLLLERDINMEMKEALLNDLKLLDKTKNYQEQQIRAMVSKQSQENEKTKDQYLRTQHINK